MQGVNPEIKKTLLDIINGVKESFNHYDAETIMELSNHIIHSVSIYQTKRLLQFAIIVYSIGKIMAKGKIRRYPQESWNEFETIVRRELNNSYKAVFEDKLKVFDKSLLKLQKAIMMLDSSFMAFTDHVIHNAMLKKGLKVYEHGVSIKRVSELFGINEWELRQYAGKSRIIDREPVKSDVKDRLKKVRAFFK